ncbi:threonine-phosphate decarboxylase CobD [Paenibacillus koleovorans]|uniref:threonine-phosphate decarboxylase CobD n=1 Tax=Paenibacillus koleovorans TaxID=121608 RepID=UPI000FDA6BDB|nr:threonine-phosphate decarboxylase CobD [Paenibacillus koleovorans]
MLEKYGHGGDLLTAAEQYGIPVSGFLDFSSNMNPFGPPSVVGEIATNQWKQLARYPDPAVRELRKALADRYGIEPESILVGNGAAELIDLAIRLIQPTATALARPSFTEYEEAAAKTNSKLLGIPLSHDNDFTPQADQLSQAAAQADLLVLGHPNNPTGQLLDHTLMRSLAEDGVELLLDEAFMDFVPDGDEVHSLLKLAARTPNLHVLRSMTKFYAIPGIRLGFIVSHPDWIRRLRERQVPWSVNSFAQWIGAAVLREAEFERKTREWLAEENPWLTGQLTALGMRVCPSSVNYLLFALPQDLSVKQLQRLLGRRGILIRDASLFEGLNESYARVAVRRREENERLVRELGDAVRQWEAGGEGGIDE